MKRFWIPFGIFTGMSLGLGLIMGMIAGAVDPWIWDYTIPLTGGESPASQLIAIGFFGGVALSLFLTGILVGCFGYFLGKDLDKEEV